MLTDLLSVSVYSHQTLRDAMVCIDKNMKAIALVLDRDGRLLYTITDGDLRRAMLNGIHLDTTIEEWVKHKAEKGNSSPITAPQETPAAELIEIMQKNSIRHVPLVDGSGKVTGLAFLEEMFDEKELPLQAVIMAGGLGIRLRPLTDSLPKPMLPVGDRPLLEWIVAQLRQAGVRRIHLTTHYRAGLISDYFGDGRRFGVQIRYVHEEKPMGTAGALALLGKFSEPVLVINGDIMTRVNFRAMYDFHLEHGADMTVAVRENELSVPYGIVDLDGLKVAGISEKPVFRHLINAGIYLLNPKVCQMVPKRTFYGMPDLIRQLMDQGGCVVGFPIREYWMDIGHLESYRKTLEDHGGAASGGTPVLAGSPQVGDELNFK